MALFELQEEDKERISNYFRKNWLRLAVSFVIFLVEFFWLFSYVQYANWKQRSFLSKSYFFLKLALVMALFEIFRWSDAIIKKYVLNKQSDKSCASPVDTHYIEKNRGYK